MTGSFDLHPPESYAKPASTRCLGRVSGGGNVLRYVVRRCVFRVRGRGTRNHSALVRKLVDFENWLVSALFFPWLGIFSFHLRTETLEEAASG